MGLFGGIGNIAKTATGLAKQVTGKTADFRKILSANPSSLSILLPPQVQMGITLANQLGLKIPTAEQLQGRANSELQKILGGLQKDAHGALGGILDKVDSNVLSGTKSVEDVLNKIDWLL